MNRRIIFKGESNIHPELESLLKEAAFMIIYPEEREFLVFKGQGDLKPSSGEGEIEFYESDDLDFVATYTGCWKDGRMEGSGVYRFLGPNGFEYVGDFLKGKRHGKGKLVFSNGCKYDGQWFQDHLFEGKKKHGDQVYVGGLKDGEPHGEGRYKCSTEKYVGQFFEGKRHGKGELSVLNDVREVFKGTFVNGKMNGYGNYNSKTKSYSGWFKDEVFHGRGHLTMRNGSYEGGFMSGQYHGKGILSDHLSQKSYAGDFVAGERHGHGIERDSNLYVYEGEWVRDQKCGFGKEKFQGGRFEGMFKDGLRNGKGQEFYESKSMYANAYDGMFKNGLKHGEGVEIVEGITQVGVWKRGLKISRKRPRQDNSDANIKCSVCLESTKNVVLDSCRHTFCGKCVDSLKTHKCPLCECVFDEAMPIYL